MKKVIILGVSLLFLISCSLLNVSKLSKSYVLKDKYLGGEILFSDSGLYRLHIKKDLLYKESTGTYLMKGDMVLLTSKWQPDTLFVSSYKIDTLKSLKIVLEDFDNIPLEGKVIVNKQFEYSFKNGQVIIDKTPCDELWVLNYNYIDSKIDTLILNNKGCNSYLIKRLNTFNYYNYLFLNKAPFLLKGKKLLNLSGSLLKDQRLKFISK